MSRIKTARLLLPSAVAAAALMFLDAAFAFTTSEHVKALSGAAIFSAVGVILNRGNLRTQLVAAALPLIVLAAVQFLYWPPRKLFVSRLESISPGMSVGAASEIMRDYRSGTGWPELDGGGELTYDDALIFRSNDQSGDWAVVRVDGGTVVGVAFWPD